MNDTPSRYREAFRAGWLGLGVNLSLGFAKLVAGLVARSSALVADAVNSLGDAFTSLVVLYGLQISRRPPDREHPYGHGRAEGIAATNVAILIIISAGIVGWEAFQRLGEVAPATPWWAIAIAGGNMVLKEWLFQYKLRVGRRTHSAAIIAHAWDHRSDAVCSMAVFASLLIISWGGPGYGWIDSVAAIVVSGGVIWSSIHLFRSSASELMDQQADSDFVKAVRETALRVTGVQEIETLLVRKNGIEYFVDIHIEVNPSITVDYGHRIGHVVKDQLLAEFPELRDVLVHLEPHRDLEAHSTLYDE